MLKVESTERQIQTMSAEKKKYLEERSDFVNKLQCVTSENEKLVKEITRLRLNASERDELNQQIENLKSEKNELEKKVTCLQENLQEVSHNFKETKWALTTEVAEKHDQAQELRRCVGVLEEQLRQADKQTHFKDDIIKELRKELKSLKKSVSLTFLIYFNTNSFKFFKNN